MKQRWEYLVAAIPPSVQANPQTLADNLNIIGEQGWELIHIIPGGLIAKRPKSAIIVPETVSQGPRR